MDVHHGGKRSTLAVAADVLALDPTASLAVIAEAAGIGRTTLHKRFPKRQDMLLAVAYDSIELMEQALIDAGMTDDETDAVEALGRFIEACVALGSRIAFLFRQPSLDPVKDIQLASDRIDATTNAFIVRAQREGLLRADQPAWWINSTLYAICYGAWENVALGRLAPLDAPKLALETALTGLGRTDRAQ